MSETAVDCPACGGKNLFDAIFCEHCDKALGPFRFVREEWESSATRHEVIADRVTGFVAQPTFFLIHTLWFLLWIAANAGIFAVVRRFDVYPYSLLSILLSVEAIFITGFLLISQNRQQKYLEKATELDYEVNVRSYREIQKLQEMLSEALTRLERLERK